MIFVDSEIWPNLIFEIKKRKTPLALINGRITKKTFDRWRLIKSFAKKIFERFDLCIASNKETENFLKKSPKIPKKSPFLSKKPEKMGKNAIKIKILRMSSRKKSTKKFSEMTKN